MKWLSVLALCAALFIAATHANHIQMIDHAAEEKILQMLLADQRDTEELEQANEETAAVYKGRLSAARDKANVQCVCHCISKWKWKKASKAQGNARAQCFGCCSGSGGWLI